MVTTEEVIKANIEVHTTMADRYHEEPHWRAENQQKVRDRLSQIAPETRNRVLDVGCGSGFLTTKLAEIFNQVDGVDVTPAMMNLMPKLSNVTLQEAPAEKLPFAEDTFDMVGSYSFIHHLLDHKPALAEMYRVLKPGGVIYGDLEPNKAFWSLMDETNRAFSSERISNSPLLAREIDATLNVEKNVEDEFGIPEDVFRVAEYSKSVTGGFSADELENELIDIGFTDVKVSLDWFLGQGAMIHGVSPEAAEATLSHLTSIRPATDGLFKYLWFTAVKK